MIKYVLGAVLLVGATAPAFAAEFFIVRGPDKRCQVVDKRPTETTLVVVGNKAYVTREEAQKELTTVCKD